VTKVIWEVESGGERAAQTHLSSLGGEGLLLSGHLREEGTGVAGVGNLGRRGSEGEGGRDFGSESLSKQERTRRKGQSESASTKRGFKEMGREAHLVDVGEVVKDSLLDGLVLTLSELKLESVDLVLLLDGRHRVVEHLGLEIVKKRGGRSSVSTRLTCPPI
jgi:hypothetical protein